MLRYIYANELHRHPKLARTMFLDRADQFRTRLGWDVRVDINGEERDDYDAKNPLYVIWENPDGRHGGSMRFLPTTGPTMVNDVFGHLTGGRAHSQPDNLGMHTLLSGPWGRWKRCCRADAGRG